MLSVVAHLRLVYIGNALNAKISAHHSHYSTCLGHLGMHNTDRIISTGLCKCSGDCHVLCCRCHQKLRQSKHAYVATA